MCIANAYHDERGLQGKETDKRSDSLKFYILTAVLSTIADANATYISPLPHQPRSKCRSKWPVHMYRSAVSADGRLAAFMTDSGHLKLAALIPNENGSGLQLRTIPFTGFQGRKEPEVHDASRIGISVDAQGYLVAIVDRYGTVTKISITEKEQAKDIKFLEEQSVAELQNASIQHSDLDGPVELP